MLCLRRWPWRLEDAVCGRLEQHAGAELLALLSVFATSLAGQRSSGRLGIKLVYTFSEHISLPKDFNFVYVFKFQDSEVRDSE